jgi:ribosomal protein S18 acetylase RimI-like enzyme
MQPRVESRVAGTADLTTLLDLREGYCRDDRVPFDIHGARDATARLLAQPQWGCIWLAEISGASVGYVAVCLGFSLEAQGNDAFIDELYVRPRYRRRGIGRHLLALAVQEAQGLGARVLHLFVDRNNPRARALYASLGFAPRERYLVMNQPLR